MRPRRASGRFFAQVPNVSPLVAYVFAVCVSAAMVGVRLSLPAVFGPHNWFIQSHPAVLLSAWVGGFGPGLLATLASAAADAYFFVPPPFSLKLQRPQVPLVLTFTAIGVLMSGLVDALRRSREERDRLLAAAHAANTAKDEFLATLSHELRTPLNAVLGWAHMLRSGTVPRHDYEKVFDRIYRNCELQARLVEDVLDYSSMVTGRFSLRLQTVDVSDVVSAAIEIVAPTLKAKQQRLRLDVPAGCIVRADSDRLRQVVWNLLSNASKFSPAGALIAVVVRCADEDVVVSVTDDGIGIESAFLPHVFDPFRQADSSATRVEGGLGLGLALVRRLVEAHGGSVSAQSPGPAKGTTVAFRVPRATPPPQEGWSSNQRSSPSSQLAN